MCEPAGRYDGSFAHDLRVLDCKIGLPLEMRKLKCLQLVHQVKFKIGGSLPLLANMPLCISQGVEELALLT